MTHFVVTVIGDDWEEQLAPFHQFECTGINNQFVIDVDITAEILDEYEKSISKMNRHIETNVMKSSYSDEFYKEVTSTDPFAQKERFVPDGWEEIDVPTKELQPFVEYAEEYCTYELVKETDTIDPDDLHKFGYILVDSNNSVVKIVRRTNPNYKWDWYSMGGRWSGKLKLKDGAIGIVNPDSFSNDSKIPAGYVDQALVKDIDWVGIREKAAQEARDEWNEVKTLAPTFWKSFEDVKVMFPDSIEDARNYYWAQPGRKALHKGGSKYIFIGDDILVPCEEYEAAAANCAGLARAYIKDGKWHEQGEALMFGMFDDKMDSNTWYTEMRKMIDELPGDTLITIVDCHI